MSVETTDRKVTHEMDELLTEYAFTFRALVTAPSDIKAIIRNSITGVSEDMEYVEDLPEEPTEDDRLKYTVAVNEDGIGGVVELAWASDDTNELTIYRETTDIQSSAYEDYNQFPASTVESDFDRRTMVTQEIKEEIGRTLKVPITVESGEVPSPVAGTYLGWDENDQLVNKSLPDPATLEIADQVDAEAGTNNTKMMTPLRTKQAIDELAQTLVKASQEEAEAGVDDTKYMTALKVLQSIIANTSAGTNPTGVVLDFAGGDAPEGYLICNGAAISRETYSDLFAVISTAYGVGDGSTTFNIPDSRNRVSVGYGSGTFDTLGKTGGAETHTLADAELPDHTHILARGGSGGTRSVLLAGADIVVRDTSSAGQTNNLWTLGKKGTSGTAHNNLQPYIVFNKIIKT